MNMVVDPKGTQTDQIPIALPLFSGGNHRATMSGAVTAMKLKPAPSINRLKSRPPMPPGEGANTGANCKEREGHQPCCPVSQPLKNESGRYSQEEASYSEYGHEEARVTRGLTEILHQEGHDRRNLELIQGGRDAREENDG